MAGASTAGYVYLYSFYYFFFKVSPLLVHARVLLCPNVVVHHVFPFGR